MRILVTASLKRRYITILIFFLSIIVVYHFYASKKIVTKPAQDPVELQYVVVHIDLKGAPPKMGYLYSILPILKSYGVNALLMEYEDMFPYEGKLVNLSAKNCYGYSELKSFIKYSIQLGLEIIPLVQTFGHLEYALKLEEFSHLREHAAYPDSICPSKEESKEMVANMLEQVLTFHASISPLKHIHVGCDEVFVINQCIQCRNRTMSNELLFEHFVRYIADVVKNIYPEVTVLIWDDMLRKINPLSWTGLDHFHNVEPVHWHYAEMVKFPYIHIMNYDKKFKNKWAASAFKGADGRTAMAPNIRKRLVNHYSWLQKLQTAKVPGKNQAFHFKGIILTGWSRYSHMDALCELLPVAMPTLIMNLKMIKLFKSGSIYTGDNIDDFFNNYLCEKDVNFYCKNYIFLSTSQYIGHCHFDGEILYKWLYEYITVINYLNSLLKMDELSVYEYYCSHSKYINKNNGLINFLNKCNDGLTKLHAVEREMTRSMVYYYEDVVIKEYITFKTHILKIKLKRLLQTFRTCLAFNGTWIRGPMF